MKPLTRDAKLTDKQWKTLWQIAFGHPISHVVQRGPFQYLKTSCGDRDISHLITALRGKGMVRWAKTRWELTAKGADYL